MDTVDRPGRIGGTGAHGAYHDSGRCPICLVPLRAPHLESCDYDGVWDGDLSGDRSDDDYEDDD